MRSWLERAHERWCWLCMLSAIACGGKAVTTSEGESGESASGSGSTDSPRDPSGDPDPDDPDPDSTIDLGECEPGWQLGEAPCPWLGSDNRCYPTKEGACACICASEGVPTCFSGFPGADPDARVRVTCE